MCQRRPLLAALALVAILFTQVAIAAAAWQDPPAPCHEMAPAQNACYEHCSNNDVTLDTPKAELAAAAAATRFSLVALAPYPQVVQPRVPVLPAGPPPRILFGSFQI